LGLPAFDADAGLLPGNFFSELLPEGGIPLLEDGRPWMELKWMHPNPYCKTRILYSTIISKELWFMILITYSYGVDSSLGL
jgi:hypothetical protein